MTDLMGKEPGSEFRMFKPNQIPAGHVMVVWPTGECGLYKNPELSENGQTFSATPVYEAREIRELLKYQPEISDS